MQGREIMILRSSIASLKQYNQYLLKRNEVLESLVKKYKKFLEDLQNKEEEEEHEKIWLQRKESPIFILSVGTGKLLMENEFGIELSVSYVYIIIKQTK